MKQSGYVWFTAEFTPEELPHTSFRWRHDELWWQPVYICAAQVPKRSNPDTHDGVRVRRCTFFFSFYWKYINNLTSPSARTHTRALSGSTYLPCLRCSLAKPQQWRRSWKQQAAASARPGTAVQARLQRVVTGHCRSIFPCVNPTLSAFTSATTPPVPALLFTLLSSIWQESGHVASLLALADKSSRHCSAPIIFYRDSPTIQKSFYFLVCFIFFFPALFRISGMDWT